MPHLLGSTTRPYASLPFDEACRHIAAAGYHDVAVFHHAGGAMVSSTSSAADVAEVRRIAADAGLRPSMLIGGTRPDLGADAALADYRRLIDNAAALGATWLLDCGTGDADRYDDYMALMRRAAPHAEQAGLKITLKPHGGITLTVEDMVRVNDAVGHPAFGICYDPGNLIYYTKGERRPEEGLDVVGQRVSTVIIKDCVVRDGKPDVMVTPGTGLVDFERVLGGLAAHGFGGPLYVECVAGQATDEIDRNLAATRTFIGDILGRIGGS